MALNLGNAIAGSLLGEALGDSVGLWCEGMTPARQLRFHSGTLRQRFLFGKGMISDDTEHALMTAQALIVSASDPDKFTRSLAWRLRWWLLGIPAGIGFATLRAILKLWVGFPASSSGIYSAGNGPCMRAGILGVCFGNDSALLRELVRRSTRLTHTDPKAEWSALAVALAAHVAAVAPVTEWATLYRSVLAQHLDPGAVELSNLLGRAADSAALGEETQAFVNTLGLQRGVTGYVYHTVPAVIQAWLRHGRDFRAGVTSVIRCGGDTDSTAAILGSIVGAAVGKNELPADWLADLREWPCGIAWIEKVAERLADVVQSKTAQRPVSKNLVGLAARNLLFAVVVLGHGFRRMLPPYG